METTSSIARPAVEVVEFTDPAVANAGLDMVDMDAVQLRSMRVQARRVIVRLEATTVVFHSVNQAVRTHTSARQGLLAYVAFGAQARGTVNGLAVAPGLLLAVEPQAEVRFVTEPGWQSITVMARPQDLRVHLATRQREDAFRPPSGVQVLEADVEKVRDLFDWGRRLVDVAARQPALFNDRPDVRMAAQAELFETLLATLHLAHEVEPGRKDRTRQAHSAIVKIAEDYALSHVGDHLYVTDLCKVAAASERTLENAFREVMGITPVAYLIRVRLHRVRKALLAATQATTTVSTEALNWGFWHFGEFSRAYKHCFGELPSDTLRRKTGAAQP
jgi:AraC family transcriptional regulator, ethanolamine operon transcriptional activator